MHLSVALAVGILVAATGCGGEPDGAGPSQAGGRLTVFAAASLTGAFSQIADGFERSHPDTSVTLSFGASSALAQQIVAGAPVDVFAAASPTTMQVVTNAGDAVQPRVFARNSLQIAVPPDNPGRVVGLADLADPARTIALCAEQVPCGAAARTVFAAAGLTPAPDTLEQDVKAALSKVELGEVDAALVYRTDVLAAGGKVRGIAFPESGTAVNDYPVARLRGAPNTAAAEAFVAYVLSPEGQRVLVDAGFDRP